MKIVESKKEILPLDFITSFVSRGWEEVGNLKASISAIKGQFSNTGAVEQILQDLLDSYLICVGRLENQIDSKKYLELPDDKTLKEDFNVADDEDEEQFIPREMAAQKKVEVHTTLPDYNVEVEQKDDKIEIELEPKDSAEIADNTAAEIVASQLNDPELDDAIDCCKNSEKTDLGAEPFDYYVDFSDPEPDVSDKSVIQAWLNRQ